MGTHEHRIGRIKLRLAAADKAVLDDTLRSFQANVEPQLLPMIQRVFDLMAAQHLVILDQLSLDLGELPADPNALMGAIERALQKAVAIIPPKAASQQSTPWPYASDKIVDPSTEGLSSMSSRHIDGSTDIATALLGFLVNGTMPFPQPGTALAAILSHLAQLRDVDMVALFRQILPGLADPAAAQRFLLQLPARTVARMILLLADWPPHLSRAAPEAPFPVGTALTLLAPLRDLAASPDAVTAASLASSLIAAMATTPDPNATLPSLDAPAPDPSPNAHPIAVTAAGGVLLHPFLATYLDACGLLAAPGRFHSDAARAQAVLLTHHLSTGQSNPPEPDCVLAKLLCGMPLHHPLPSAIQITPQIAAESDVVLQALIRHWPKLGRTSPDGLRAGFLLRPGALTITQTAHTLQIERKAQDVLLDHLPWTISLIKTAFMSSLLRVEWR